MTFFWEDLRAATAVWLRAPGMVVIEFALGVIVFAGGSLLQLDESPGLGLLVFPLVIVQLCYLGWLGGQRAVYAGAFRGELPPSPRDMAASSRAYVGRFFTLGFVAGLLVAPLLILTAVVGGGATWLPFVLTAVVFIVDIGATLVTPALALDTDSVREAIEIGVTLLRRNWDAVRWHVLVAPLAFVALPRLFDANPTVSILINLLTLPLLFAIRGAVVRAYLRLDADDVVLAVQQRANALHEH